MTLSSLEVCCSLIQHVVQDGWNTASRLIRVDFHSSSSIYAQCLDLREGQEFKRWWTGHLFRTSLGTPYLATEHIWPECNVVWSQLQLEFQWESVCGCLYTIMEDKLQSFCSSSPDSGSLLSQCRGISPSDCPLVLYHLKSTEIQLPAECRLIYVAKDRWKLRNQDKTLKQCIHQQL